MSARRPLLFVVAAGRADLVEFLGRQFADVADAIEIIPDRRVGERRQRAVTVGTDRRVTDRRTHDVEHDLQTMGWAFVRRG